MNAVVAVARLFLAAVFALAAVSKLLDRAGSVRSMRDFGVPSALAQPFATVLPVFELACAVALIPAASARWGAIGVLALLALFIVAIAVNLARGCAPDCRCFGQLHSEPVGSKTIVRNVLLAVIAAPIVWQGADANTSLIDPLAGAAGSATLSAALAWISTAIAAFALYVVFNVLRQNGRLLVRLEAIEARLGIEPAPAPAPGLPVDSAAPDFSLRDLDGKTVNLATLVAGDKPLLLVFSEPGCTACDALLPDVAAWQREFGERMSAVVISRGSISENRNKQSALALERVLLQKDRETAEAYGVVGTPSAVLIERGRIASPLAAGGDAIRSLVADVTSARVRKGQPAPDLTLVNLRNEPFSLGTLRGRRSLLVFWNPTCGYCQKMLDDLRRRERNRPASAPSLVVISSGSAEANREQGFSSLVLLDDAFQAGQAFGVSGTPAAIFLDETGLVISEIGVGADAVLAMADAKGDSPHFSW